MYLIQLQFWGSCMRPARAMSVSAGSFMDVFLLQALSGTFDMALFCKQSIVRSNKHYGNCCYTTAAIPSLRRLYTHRTVLYTCVCKYHATCNSSNEWAIASTKCLLQACLQQDCNSMPLRSAILLQFGKQGSI